MSSTSSFPTPFAQFDAPSAACSPEAPSVNGGRPIPGPSSVVPPATGYVWPSKLAIDTEDDYFEYAFDFVWGEDYEETADDTAEEEDEVEDNTTSDELEEDTDIDEPSSTFSLPWWASAQNIPSPNSSLTESSSVEPESDDAPTAQAASPPDVLVPLSNSQLNAPRSDPVPGQYNLRSSARLREKRKREVDDGTEKENNPLGEQFSDLADDADASEPGPSRPAKRRRVELNESEDEDESEGDEEDSLDGQSDEENAADDEEPTQGPATSPKKCLLGGCQYQLSDSFQQNWDHMLKPNHFNKNTDGLFPCTYPKCPGFDGASGCKGKQALQRHVMSEHWRNKVWCTWPGCRNFYYRKDVLQKHMKRHTE
ncbi:hypothetical protein VTO73DRAFT_11266 [Trametes versicolor]